MKPSGQFKQCSPRYPMIKALKCDLSKTIVSFGFVIAVLVTFLLCFTETAYVDSYNNQRFSVYEVLLKFDMSFIAEDSSFNSLKIYKSALSGYSAMFLPVLASFPFVFSQCAERNSGNIRFSIFRTHKIKFYLSKYISAFLSGGLGIALGVFIFGIISFCVFPGIESYPHMNFEYYAPEGVFLEVCKKLFSSFIYGSVSTMPAFFLSSFCRNKYLILCVPFLLRFMLDTATKKIVINTPDYEFYKLVFPFESYAPSQIPYLKADSLLFSTIAVTLISSFLILVGYILIMEHRIDKGG